MENISNQYQRQTMKNWILILVLSVMTVGYVNAQKSTLQKQGTATQLVVDGKPFLILGGELGNSSAACTEDIERIFPKLQRMGLNTVLVPAYWDLIEPQEGQFDFTLTDSHPSSPAERSESNFSLVRCLEELHELLRSPLVQRKL